ncbi:acyl-CoA dehydrogenase family protein [Halopenitus sp. POP-27]|uniref:acyl-CoA dehydrogenase family protein n=1 Tax=Halopenitus sp. POP-27 TaxID=2994425 RepID=UPI0024694355|nr:acyl-CoA dehydrogenase family protein [Halopenitus sp. POP-27]
MQFGLTDEQQAVRETVREFAENEIEPVAQEYNRNHEYPREIVDQANEMGLTGSLLPVEYGGTDMGYLTEVVITEELCRVDPAIGVAIGSWSAAANLIVDHGTEKQKEAFVQPTAEGEMTGGVAITEPQGGSDVTGIETTAKQDGDEYVINGTKLWITNGGIADYTIVFARTGPRKEDDPHEGISAFIVDTDQEGYSTEDSDLMGLHAENNTTVYLDDARVAEWRMIGEEGEAFLHLMDWFNKNRAKSVGAFGIGLAQGAFDKAFSYAREREQFDETLTDFQGLQWKFADMSMRIESARQLTYRTASLLDEGVVSPKHCALAKIKASETAREVANEALQLHGGHGYSKDYRIEQYYRDAKIFEIFEGTNEICRNIVAKELIKDGGLVEYRNH